MSYYIRYVLTDEKSITLAELDQALQTINSGYEIDGDLVVFEDKEFGQIEINEKGEDLFDNDLMLLHDFAEKKQNNRVLLAELNKTKQLVTVQVIFSWEGNKTLKVIEPLFDWLLANRTGLVITEGGWFYDKSGEIT